MTPGKSSLYLLIPVLYKMIAMSPTANVFCNNVVGEALLRAKVGKCVGE